MRLFTNEQKREVSKLARRAYDAWEGREAFEECNGELSKTACFEAWRHAEIYKVTRRTQSLRECISEHDYQPLMAHFAHMVGDGAGALSRLLRHAEGNRIQIFHKLQVILAERGLDEAYANKIARCKFKRDLGDLSEKQLWSIFFDCKKRPVVAREKQRAAPKRIKENLGTLSTEKTKPAADPVGTLQARMAAAVKAENYEEAARLRDQIRDLTPAEAPF